MNRWTVHVEDFGKIEKADVEIAPLTMFVGDNNSGKSYMMTLIYGLLSVRFFHEGFRFENQSEAYQNCKRIIEHLTDIREDREYILREEELKQFQYLINECLNNNKNDFIRYLFNKEMQIGKIEMDFPENLELNFWVSYSAEEENLHEGIVLQERIDGGKLLAGYGTSINALKSERGCEFLMSYIMQCMIRGGLEKESIRKRIYLPTTRTGFLLTYKTLAGNAMQEKFTLEETNKNLLTKPNSEFLRELSSMSTDNEKGQFEKVVRFIENHIISGHVNVSDLPVQDLTYTPEGSDKKLPLYITSGVVTEMTPLLLFLKYTDLGALLIEEPEISLHPQLQWKVARVLIQLMNEGLPVFVTTHSDLILQHINNMIKANDMLNKNDFLKKTDYVENDLLQREQIRVYQFEVQENYKTKVRKLPCGDYGFEAMTFYQTLEKMNSEIDWIENGE